MVHDAFKWLWKSACQNKHKVFFWFLLQDRLNTRDLLRRRNKDLPDYNYVCCPNSIQETLVHLVIHCPFAQNCWASSGLLVGQDDPFVTLIQLKNQLQVPFFFPRPCLGTFFIKRKPVASAILHGDYHL